MSDDDGYPEFVVYEKYRHLTTGAGIWALARRDENGSHDRIYRDVADFRDLALATLVLDYLNG